MWKLRLLIATANEHFWRGWAYSLPKRVAYWAAVRVMAYATGPDFPHSDPGRTSVTIALKRWS